MPASTVASCFEHPDAELIALEEELEPLLVRYAILRAAWPRAGHILKRAEIGRQVHEALTRIGEI